MEKQKQMWITQTFNISSQIYNTEQQIIICFFIFFNVNELSNAQNSWSEYQKQLFSFDWSTKY